MQERQASIGDVSTIVIPFTDTTFPPSSMLRRPSTFALTKSLLLLISHIPSLHSRPLGGSIELFKRDDGFPEEDPATAAFWWKFGVGLVLVLLGGVFAGISLCGDANLGLTLALLSQDEITVTPEEKKLMEVTSFGSERRPSRTNLRRQSPATTKTRVLLPLVRI